MNVKASSIRAIYDRLLVRPIFDELTRGGLIVPELHKQKVPYFLAEVVSAGHGRVTEGNTTVPLLVKVGDCVMVERKAGFVLPVEGENLMMISEMHVLAIIERQEESQIVLAS